MQKRHSAVSSQQSVVGTSRRLVRPAVKVVGTSRRLVRSAANYAIARRKLEQSAKKLRTLGSVIPPATGPRTRDQHLSALSAKIDATHKAMIVAATGICNLQRKLRRQQEIYRTLAHNYGSRTAEHTRQIVETSANNS